MDSGWFRNLGQRSKGRASPSLTPIPEGKNEGDNSRSHRRQHSSSPFSPKRHRRAHPAVHKVSSFLTLNLGSSGRNKDFLSARSSPTPTAGTLSSAEDASEQQDNRPPRRKYHENTWYNPSLMQIVETVQVAMMSNPDPLTPIPVKYNSYVLRLAEGLAHTIEQVRDLEVALGELKNVREKELEEFRGISDEWIRRENGYKAEIKRLEMVMASESKDGMASVVLARSGTLVDRSGSKKFQATLKRMSNPEEGESPTLEKLLADGSRQTATIKRTDSHHKTIENIPRILDHNSDVIMSQTVARGGRVLAKAHVRRGRAPTSHPQSSHHQAPTQPGYVPMGTDHLARRRIPIFRPPVAAEEDDSSSQSSIYSDSTSSTEDENMELRQRSELASEPTGFTGCRAGGESSLGAIITREDDQESLDSDSVDPSKHSLQRTFVPGPRRRTPQLIGSRQTPASIDLQHMNTSREPALAASCVQSGTSGFYTRGNNLDPPARDLGKDDASGAMSRSISRQSFMTPGEDCSSPVQPQPQIQRRRRFSFEAGDNDVLPLAPAITRIPPPQDAHAKVASAVEKLSKSPVVFSMLACEGAPPPSRGPAGSALVGLQASGRPYRRTAAETALPAPVEDTTTGYGTLPTHVPGPDSTVWEGCENIPPSDSTGSVVYVGGGGTNGGGNCVGNVENTSPEARLLHMQEPPGSGNVHLGDGLRSIKHLASSTLISSEEIRDESLDRVEAKQALRTDALASTKGTSSVITGYLRRGGVVAASRGNHHYYTPPMYTPINDDNTESRDLDSRSSSSATRNVFSPTAAGTPELISIHASTTGLEVSGRAARIAAARAVARGNRIELDKQTQRVPESG